MSSLPKLPRRKLSLVGRSILLVLAELCANLAMWITALALFLPDSARRGILSLALIAWTLGLRHGLGALLSFRYHRMSELISLLVCQTWTILSR